MRTRFALLFLIGSVTLPASSAWAERVELRMTAEPDRIAAGQPFELEVRCEVEGAEPSDVRLPRLPGFLVLSRRVSRPFEFRMSLGGPTEVVQSTVVHRLTLQPTTPGTYEIPAATVRVRGREYSSNRLRIVVEPNAGAGAAAAGAPAVPTPPATATPSATTAALDVFEWDDRAFLRTVADVAKPYVGQQVTVTVYLYTRDTLRSPPVSLKEPTAEGFWTYDLLPPAQPLEGTRQLVRGQPYVVYVLRRFAAFPLKAGTATIHAPEAEVQMGSLFDVFTSGLQPYVARGVPLRIPVRELPRHPKGDQALVGDYTIETALEPKQVSTGRAATFTAKVHGYGNLHDVRLELPTVHGLRVFPPQLRDQVSSPGDRVSGTRTVEWIVVAERPGNYPLAPATLAIFDPLKGVYKTLAAAPVSLRATGADRSTKSAPAPFERRPSFGRLRTRAALAREEAAMPVALQLGALAVPPVLFTFALVFAWRRRRRDTAPGSEKRDMREAYARLATARELAARGDARAFYSEISRTLTLAIEYKLGERIGSFTYTELGVRLTDAGIPEEVRRPLLEELEGTDFARFSSEGASSPEMTRCADRTRALLDALDSAQSARRTT